MLTPNHSICKLSELCTPKKSKNFAFTLAELLIALAIVGAIAAMSIPSIVNNIQKRILVTQLRNVITSVQQVIDNQKIANNTKSLSDTDFANPAKLLSSSNFAISKTCTTAQECWSQNYRRLSDGASTTRVYENAGAVVKLKNGVIMSYSTYSLPELPDGDKAIGIMNVDINGDDKPNIIGRDVFWLIISREGHIMDYVQANNTTYDENQSITACQNASVITKCLSVIMENNWSMPY
jgi:prepilin-type N-terminal cleavage/methylation domain-containing protein